MPAAYRYLALYKPVDVGIYEATGFTSGNFGTPCAGFLQSGAASGFAAPGFGTPTHRRGQPVQGVASAGFGTPFGRNIQVVSGFTSGSFGIPRIYPFHVAPGNQGQFGSPAGRQYWRAHALIMPGRFGTPFVTFNQSQTASGFTSGSFGTPLGMRIQPPNVSRICIAQPVMPGHFGTPRYTPAQAGAASPIGPGSFGTPKNRRTQPASGFSSPGFGAPASRMLTRAHGIGHGAFGAPTCRRTQQASSLYRAPRWGVAKAVRSNTYEAASIYVGTRIGHPTGRIVNGASGFTGGAFGTPATFQTHRVSSIPPSGRFGRPLLKRIPQC